MEKNFSILGSINLFDGMNEEEIRRFLSFSGYTVEHYKRNDVIWCEGDENNRIGVILSGDILAERVFPDGEIATASKMGVGGVIGDVLSGSSTVSPVTVIAADEVEILFFPLSAFLEPNENLADIQLKLTKNLIMDISDKYFQMEKRVSVMAAGPLRRKIMLYLCNYCRNSPGHFFTIPHTREQQADYIGCERTALSRELAKMKTEGLIDYHKNDFRVMPEGHICRMVD